jgi:adenosylcobinamide hydrolase
MKKVLSPSLAASVRFSVLLFITVVITKILPLYSIMIAQWDQACLVPCWRQLMKAICVLWLEKIGLDPARTSGIGTAADMKNAAVVSAKYEELSVAAVVTGGIERNAGRVGDPASYYKPEKIEMRPGTINIMLFIDCNMPAGTLARALVTCTEAKSAAIQELLEGSCYSTGIATGSGTDQTIIVANTDSKLYLDDAGKHAKLGELIGTVVKQAVKEALDKQTNLNPATQHNALSRLKRFGVTADNIWEQYKASGQKTFAETTIFGTVARTGL